MVNATTKQQHVGIGFVLNISVPMLKLVDFLRAVCRKYGNIKMGVSSNCAHLTRIKPTEETQHAQFSQTVGRYVSNT